MKRDEASAPEGTFARLLFDIANSHTLVEAELRKQPPIMTMVEQRKIHALLCAYDKALADPHARIPTYLHAACEALK